MFIDTHAHLDFKEFDNDREEVIYRAINGGVERIINVGCNLERSIASVNLAEKYRNIYTTVGIHPNDVKKYKLNSAIAELEKISKSKKVIAIGECGLDYYRINSENDKKIQIEFFKAQIELAQKLNLPLVIHCRDAFYDLLEILNDTKYKFGVTHCFSGNRKMARNFLKLGFLLSFTGSITYAKLNAEILKVVEEIPLDKIMIETDSPYLAPVPKRGKRNEPFYVRYIAEKIAFIKKVNLKEIEEITTKNAKRLFNLK